MHLNGLLLAFNGKLLAFGRGAYRAWERAIARPSSRPQRQPYLLTAASALTFAFRISRVKLQQCMRLVQLIGPRCVHAVQWCWWPVWSTSIIIFMQHVDGATGNLATEYCAYTKHMFWAYIGWEARVLLVNAGAACAVCGG